jgi:hypothetical protein
MALELAARGSEDVQALLAGQIGGQMQKPRLALARRALHHHHAPEARLGVTKLLLDDFALLFALDKQLNASAIATSPITHFSMGVVRRAASARASKHTHY